MNKKSIKVMSIILILLFTAFGVCSEASESPEMILERMSVEEKVAQMFLTRCPTSGALSTVEKYQPGGYLLFAGHFEEETPDSIREQIESWQDASQIPMLIGVDEEGGTVTRVSRFEAFSPAKHPSPRALFDQGGLPAIIDDAQVKNQMLLNLGVNFNLAPVADISVSSKDFMYARSLGQRPETTSIYVASVVSAMNEMGIASALKHFPGYGNNRDTHNGIAVDKRPYETFVNEDFLPFEAGIRAGAGCIMVSHNIIKCMDGERPASLSPKVHEILREELNFEGVIMTDDLYMGAIKEYTSTGAAAVLAVEAGNDLLCCTDFAAQYAAVLKAVQSGRIDESRIDESVLRILKWKASLHLFS